MTELAGAEASIEAKPDEGAGPRQQSAPAAATPGDT